MSSGRTPIGDLRAVAPADRVALDRDDEPAELHAAVDDVRREQVHGRASR